MDSFTFKGISSTSFNGLCVTSLPPITKPPMRVEEIVIDGRDGSIYKDLGYSAYKKTIEIAKMNTIDIENLKSWLDGEGTLIISSENDKYYKAKIIDNIDYSRFILYGKDKITFQVQPYKYSTTETKQTFNITNQTEITISNNGNCKSKPKITIYGSGTINLSLNSIQVFVIELGEEANITIDIDKMEAYKSTTLKNRLVTGDYDNFTLVTGNNTISFTGTVTKIEIENYSRWL
jgi:predicted phage tail component-like protein